MSPINISIIGATGYTGLELIRLSLAHPQLKLQHVVTLHNEEKNLSELYPHLQNICDLKLEKFNCDKLVKDSDCVFLALPHGESQNIVKQLIGKVKIIDLGGDFRLKDESAFKKYYSISHNYKAGLKKFTYGLPEIFKAKIKKAQNIANPGCFALASQLALFPLKNGIEKAEILAITGSSGSGKQPKTDTHHPLRNHNLQSYKIGTHQHMPEIIQALGIAESQLTFVPTSGPFTRGIHLTVFAHLKNQITKDSLQKLFSTVYKNCPFVRLKNNVAIAEIVGSNYCDISVNILNNTAVIQAVIDNLVKGAAGTAVQNLNLMFGMEEKTGLENLSPMYP